MTVGPVGAVPQAGPHVALAHEPAAGQVGGAAGGDAADGLEGRGVARGGGPEDGARLVVEGDDREPVVGAKEAREAPGSLAGRAERLAAHGAGAVEHEGDVDGRAAGGRLAGQGDEHRDLVGVLGGQDAGGELDVGFHGPLGRR